MPFKSEDDILLEHKDYIASTVYKMLGTNTRKYELSGEIDDLLQEASIGFLMAYRKYDATKRVSLKTFSAYYIMGYVLHYIREQPYSNRSSVNGKDTIIPDHRRIVYVGLNINNVSSSGGDKHISCETASDCDYIINSRIYDDVGDSVCLSLLLNCLKPKELNVVILRYQGFTFAEIAKACDTSSTSITRLYSSAMKKINKEM